MAEIHPSAIISKKAHLPSDAQVGPYVIIEDDVVIGGGVKILAHAYLCSGTIIGDNCEVHMGAVLGHTPQHLKFKGAKTYLKIGDRNIFREYCSVHRGLEEGSSTVIGDDNFLMGFSHVAHDCTIADNVVICNGALIAGHAQVEEKAFISGNVTVHQFVKIGRLAMIGGLARINKDVVPYTLVEGDSQVCSLNLVGIDRAGIGQKAKAQIKAIYKILYRSDLNVSQALEKIKGIGDLAEEARRMADFVELSERGICRHRKIIS